MMAPPPIPDPKIARHPILLVCGDTARNPARSGIQTVVRSLAAAFGRLRAPVQPVVWNPAGRELRPLPAAWSVGLGAEALRVQPPPRSAFLHQPGAWLSLLRGGGATTQVGLHRYPRRHAAPPGTWVLLPELVYGPNRAEQLVDHAHRHGWRLAAILYDMIPIQHPGFVPPQLPGLHLDYLRALSRADLLLPISRETAQGWHDFATQESLPSPPVQTCDLACDLPGVARVREVSDGEAEAGPGGDATVRLLCVSTLEPRKNHRALFSAFELARARRPDLDLHLDLVGAPYVGAHELADAARTLSARHPERVRWHPHCEHAALLRLYAACDFTVYPSLVEGFGLPVIESLWLGRPCVCADFGVMAENAAGGGCVTCDVREPGELAEAILQLASDPARRRRLAREATQRPLKTWQEYARDVLWAMQG